MLLHDFAQILCQLRGRVLLQNSPSPVSWGLSPSIFENLLAESFFICCLQTAYEDSSSTEAYDSSTNASFAESDQAPVDIGGSNTAAFPLPPRKRRLIRQHVHYNQDDVCKQPYIIHHNGICISDPPPPSSFSFAQSVGHDEF